jgi:hypothetical protein
LFGTEQNQTVTENSPEGSAAAQQLMPILLQMLTSQDFSQEAAGRDAQGQVDMIIKQMMEGGIPNILNAENISGGYAGTTATLLKNDLASRAAGEGANRIATVRNQYAGQRNAQSTLMIQLINAMTNANRVRSTSTNNQGLVQNRNAQRAAGLAALLAMLNGKKKPDKNTSGKKPPEMGGGGPRTRSPKEEFNALAGTPDRPGRGDADEGWDANNPPFAAGNPLSERGDADEGWTPDGSFGLTERTDDIWNLEGGMGDSAPGGQDYTDFDAFDGGGFASSEYTDFDASGDQFDFADLGDIGDFLGDERTDGEFDSSWDFLGDENTEESDFWSDFDTGWDDWGSEDIGDMFGGSDDYSYVDDWSGDY